MTSEEAPHTGCPAWGQGIAASTSQRFVWHPDAPRRTVDHMTTPDRDRHATITTPRGSVVTIPFLTPDEAAQIADAYGPAPDPLPQPATAEDTQPCGQCNGNGHWYENVEVTTPSGGKVVTQKRVNCRACGGTGRR